MADAPHNPAEQAIAAVTAAAATPAAQPQLPLEAAAAAPAVAAAPAPATILPAAAPAEGGAAAVAPAASPTADAPKIELTSEKPSLLDKHDTTAAEKTKAAEPAKAAEDDKKPVEAAKPGEPVKPTDEAARAAEAAKVAAEAAKPAEPAKPDPIEYKYKLPDTLKMDDTLKGEVHGAFDAFRADPTNAQPLIDLHNRTMENYAKQLADQTLANQHKAFNTTRDGWAKDVLADQEIGGAGHQTAMTAIARARDLLVSGAKPGSPQYLADYKAHEDFLRITGAGDHPVYLKMLHRAARYFDEPTPPGENPKPPPDNGKAPGRTARVLYDNPRSNVNRQ